MRQHLNELKLLRVLMTSSLAMGAAMPAVAVSMKTSDDGGGTHVGGTPPCIIGTVASNPIGSPGPVGSTALRQANNPKPATKGQAQMAKSAAFVPRLKIGYTATWVLKGGAPLVVQFCIKPTIQNIGNVPWTAPFTLQMLDGRMGDDLFNEDPNGQTLGAAIPGTSISHLTHTPQSFISAPVSASIPVGATITIQAPDWCGKTVKWYQRPKLVIVSQGTGMDNSCPVVFGPPNLDGAVESPRRPPIAKE